MKSETRKAAVAAYKERKVTGGIYAIRCETTGGVWVGHCPDIETIQTREWFSLRHGGHPNKGLQAEWNTHGEADFTFVSLERIAEDAVSQLMRNSHLKDRAVHWREQLQAGVL